MLPAIEGNHNISSEDAAIEDVKVDFLAEGGYNYVWLVSFSSKPSEQDGTTSLHTAILREPNDDAFLPWQIENEVAHLTFIAKDHPSIPVPKVYAYDDGKTGNEPYITMEYIDGQPLDSVWTAYSEDEKLAAARQVAQTIIEMGTITFDRIGGLTLEHEIGQRWRVCVCVCNSYIGGPCPCSYPFPLKGVAQSATVFTHSALRPCPASVPHLRYGR